jgi:hypothetical protein
MSVENGVHATMYKDMRNLFKKKKNMSITFHNKNWHDMELQNLVELLQ